MEGWIPTDVNGETVWVQAHAVPREVRGLSPIAPKPDQHGEIPPVTPLAEGEVTTPTSSLRKEFEGWKSGIKEIITDNIELKLTLSAISMLSIISLFVLSHTRSV